MIRSSVKFAGLGVLLLATALPAQAPSQKNHEHDVIKIVRLNHIDAHNATEAISEIGLPIRVASVDGNSIVLRGPSEEVERIITQVIPAMDAAQVGAESESQMQLIPLNVAPTAMLLQLLETATAGSRARFAIDQQNRLLVVNAIPSAFESIKKVVAQLDRPSPSLTLEFFFIQASIGNDRQGGDDALPKSLESVKRALNETGLANLTLLAPLVVRTDSRNNFDSNGSRTTNQDSDAGWEHLDFRIHGVARLQSDGKTVQLDVKGGMTGARMTLRAGNEPARWETDFGLSTSITTRLGDYVVLAASPSTTSEGDAVALAVRVNSP